MLLFANSKPAPLTSITPIHHHSHVAVVTQPHRQAAIW